MDIIEIETATAANEEPQDLRSHRRKIRALIAKLYARKTELDAQQVRTGNTEQLALF